MTLITMTAQYCHLHYMLFFFLIRLSLRMYRSIQPKPCHSIRMNRNIIFIQTIATFMPEVHIINHFNRKGPNEHSHFRYFRIIEWIIHNSKYSPSIHVHGMNLAWFIVFGNMNLVIT